MELQVPAPTIDFAVTMRDMSVFEQQRRTAAGVFNRPVPPFTGDAKPSSPNWAVRCIWERSRPTRRAWPFWRPLPRSMSIHLDLEAVARIWRGGCIIRAALLEDIRKAYRSQPGLANLLLDPEISEKVMAQQEDLRRVVGAAIEFGLPVLVS